MEQAIAYGLIAFRNSGTNNTNMDEANKVPETQDEMVGAPAPMTDEEKKKLEEGATDVAPEAAS